MHTKGLSANGSRIVFESADESEFRYIGTAYGLDGTLTPTREAVANAWLWAGADRLFEACRAVDADIERDGVVSAETINMVRAAMKSAVKP